MTVVPYWYDFIAKYVTKTNVGYNAKSNSDAGQARKTIVWACPAWDGYVGSGVQDLGIYAQQMGIGPSTNMTFSEDNPKTGVDYPVLGNLAPVQFNKDGSFQTVDNNGAGTTVVTGNFPRQVQVSRRGAERLLFADTRFWICESKAPPTDGTFPNQPVPSNSVVYTAGVNGQTLVDLYRHGKTPDRVTANNTLSSKGGKVAFNILYCDGHVSGSSEPKEAYRAYRMRYPG